MKLWFGTALVISFVLASCAAKNAPSRVTVNVGDDFGGVLHLRPCTEGAKEPITADAQGNGEMAACPLGALEIVVVKGGRSSFIDSENVTVMRAGDGFPVSVVASIP